MMIDFKIYKKMKCKNVYFNLIENIIELIIMIFILFGIYILFLINVFVLNDKKLCWVIVYIF